MTSKDFVILADAMGESFALAGEDNREIVYDCVYLPLVKRLQADNPRFDTLRFSHACAVAEGKYLNV